MKLQNIPFIFLLFSLLTGPGESVSAATQPSPMLQKADSLFAQRAYTEALPLYQQVLDDDQLSPAMLLKMAYIKEGLGHVPEALYLLNIYYRETSDEEALQRIKELAGRYNLTGYDVPGYEYLRSLLRRFHTPIVLTLLITAILLTLLIVFRRLRQQHKSIITSLFLMVILGSLFYFVNYRPAYSKCILMQDNTYLMAGPSAGAGVVTQLKAGHRLEVVGREDVWVKVIWNNEIAYVREGFIKTV